MSAFPDRRMFGIRGAGIGRLLHFRLVALQLYESGEFVDGAGRDALVESFRRSAVGEDDSAGPGLETLRRATLADWTAYLAKRPYSVCLPMISPSRIGLRSRYSSFSGFSSSRIFCAPNQPSALPSFLARRSPVRVKFLSTLANPAPISSRNAMRFLSTPFILAPRRAKQAIKTTRPEKTASAKVKNAHGTVAIISFIVVLLSSRLRVAA